MKMTIISLYIVEWFALTFSIINVHVWIIYDNKKHFYLWLLILNFSVGWTGLIRLLQSIWIESLGIDNILSQQKQKPTTFRHIFY